MNLENKTFLITGVYNKKSVAYFVAKTLLRLKARIILSVQNEDILAKVKALFPDCPLFICDVSREEEVKLLGEQVLKNDYKLSGFLHCMAYFNYHRSGVEPFHETKIEDFIESMKISCFSLLQLSQSLKESLTQDASVVTISISSTNVPAYGPLGPIKAMLESMVPYLAKSFSSFSNVRFNAVCAGPLKTISSSALPNYLDNYLYSEQLTLRKKALTTQEVANTTCFLLSDFASGINAQRIVIDAGMSCNYFDQDIVANLVKKIY